MHSGTWRAWPTYPGPHTRACTWRAWPTHPGPHTRARTLRAWLQPWGSEEAAAATAGPEYCRVQIGPRDEARSSPRAQRRGGVRVQRRGGVGSRLAHVMKPGAHPGYRGGEGGGGGGEEDRRRSRRRGRGRGRGRIGGGGEWQLSVVRRQMVTPVSMKGGTWLVTQIINHEKNKETQTLNSKPQTQSPEPSSVHLV